MSNNRRRSSLVAIHADKDTQQGSVDARGIGLLVIVLAAIIAFWVNEFIPSEDADTMSTAEFMAQYKKGGGGGVRTQQHGGGGAKQHVVSPFKIGSMKECEKLVAEALKDYVDRQTAIEVEEEEEDSEEHPPPTKGKKKSSSKKQDDSGEDEVKGKGKKQAPAKGAKPKKK